VRLDLARRLDPSNAKTYKSRERIFKHQNLQNDGKVNVVTRLKESRNKSAALSGKKRVSISSCEVGDALVFGRASWLKLGLALRTRLPTQLSCVRSLN